MSFFKWLAKEIMTKTITLIPELKVLDFNKGKDDFAMLSINDARLMIEGINDKSRS